MTPLRLSAKIWIVALASVATVILTISIVSIGLDFSQWLIIFLLATGITFLDLIPIKIFGGFIEMTISNAVKFAAVLLFPSEIVIWSTFIGTWMGEIPVKRIWYKKIFNISAMTVTLTIVTLIYTVVRDPAADLFGSFRNVVALLLAGLADFGVNSFLVTLVISLASRLPFRYIWAQNFSKVIWYDLSMVPLGTFLAILWRFNPFSVPLAALPLLVVRHSYQVANYLESQTREALIAMMRVIDERDQHTADHSEKVSYYARITAEALKLDQEEIEVVAQAALLHDLGKVGMQNDVLFNPKLLTPEERRHAEKHATIGGELLAKFPLFARGAILVRHHHERFDGTGYPDKLKRDEIPIGARIISVADSYQAMTEDRPYRRAMDQQIALERLREASGGQFDPNVVQAFLHVVPRNLGSSPAQSIGSTQE